MTRATRLAASLAALGALLAISGCIGQRPFPAPPAERYEDATVAGFPGIRFWGDATPDGVGEELQQISQQTRARALEEGELPNDGRIDILVLSGGGSDGAYGAGLLNGWTARGDRPEFALVTGISTGALIAPYAFVGREFDTDLERFFTNTRTSDVVAPAIYDVLVGDSLGLADTAGFFRTIDAAVDPDLMRRIAEEHRKGRRLWIGTTNLDAQRPVIWNVGAIAVSGEPGARGLIRDILIASASIPGAFSPQLFLVEIDGERYTEMHVDGGVSRQLFLYPLDLNLAAFSDQSHGSMRPGTIYVVRNTQLDPSYQGIPARVLEITARSISTLIKYSGVADVELIRTQAAGDGFGLKLTAVPASFDVPESELFDPVYMRALFDTGYRAMLQDDPWVTALPSTP